VYTHGRVTCRVHGRVTCRVPVTRRSCTRPAKTARTRPYNGRAVYTTRTRPCMGRAHGPSTPPVYMTVYGPSARTSSAVYTECTRHVYGRVHVSTCTRAVYTRVRDIYTAENGRLHGRTRPCNVSRIRPCMGRIGSCTRQCTGRVHGRFRPCTLAVYTAVFGRLHSAYTHGRVTARVLGRVTAVYKGRLRRVYGR